MKLPPDNGHSRPTLALVAVSCAVLAVGPVLLTLLRADGYRASSTLSLTRSVPTVAPAAQVSGVENLVRNVLLTPQLRKAVVGGSDWFGAAKDLEEHVRLEARWARGHAEVVVAVLAADPDEARALNDTLGPLLLSRSEETAQSLAKVLVSQSRARLREDDLSKPAGKKLRQRIVLLSRFTRGGQRVFAPNTKSVSADEERIGDRIIGVLPGSTPPRPSPLWAALAGVALAAALGLWALALAPRQRPGVERNTGDVTSTANRD